uniref:Uncharacterized protein n=1 Tax=Setaria italica TaxID=4555 RepID=K3YWP3_SETIT
MEKMDLAMHQRRWTFRLSTRARKRHDDKYAGEQSSGESVCAYAPARPRRPTTTSAAREAAAKDGWFARARGRELIRAFARYRLPPRPPGGIFCSLTWWTRSMGKRCRPDRLYDGDASFGWWLSVFFLFYF